MVLRQTTLVASLLVVASLFVAACAPAADPATASAVSTSTTAAASTSAPQATATPATASATATTAAGTAVTTPQASTATSVSTAPTSAVPGTTVTLDSASKARYIAKEQLAGKTLPNEAVGTTTNVTGKIVLSADGTARPDDSVITVGLQTLKSDDGRRDNYIQNNPLQTRTYQNAVFKVKSINGLNWPLPNSGTGSFTMIGELTVHGVTKPVTWTVDATFASGKVTGLAKTTVTFSDFGMTAPTTFIALSVENTLRLEIDISAAIQQA